jgi:predicted PurR-regulated permease PerM
LAPAASREWPASVATAARLVTLAIVCAVLYWGQVVLVPLALAALITFLLAPLVGRLDKLRVPRVLGVIIVATGVLAALTGLGYLVVGQVGELARELPAFRYNIRDRLEDAQEFFRGGTIQNVQTTISDIAKEVDESVSADADDEAGDERAPDGAAGDALRNGREPEEEGEAEEAEEPERPVPVEVVPERPLLGNAATWSPALETMATLGITVLLTLFMLIRREDLRNRLVSLAGETSVVVTSKAFADAGQRISRYLLMQFIINVTMGFAVWFGLFLIGVPYAALWGLAAAILRYIPYVGPWIAAVLPISVTLVMAPGWEQVLFVVGLFVVLELLSNNVMEPWLYGHSVGLSAISVVVSAIFWTWLWGPIGLVMATPLTVCLVVLSRHVPELAIFDRLLSDRPAHQSHLWLYQRLLSHDEEEAESIIRDHLGEHSLVETCDHLLLQALVAVKRDLAAGRITADEGEFVAQALSEIIDDLPLPDDDDERDGEEGRGAYAERGAQNPLVIGFPATNRFDEIGLEILRLLLRREAIELEILSPELLVGERVAEVEARRPAAVCIGSLPPGDLTATRHAVKRLQARVPEVKLVVGRLGAPAASQRTTDQ